MSTLMACVGLFFVRLNFLKFFLRRNGSGDMILPVVITGGNEGNVSALPAKHFENYREAI